MYEINNSSISISVVYMGRVGTGRYFDNYNRDQGTYYHPGNQYSSRKGAALEIVSLQTVSCIFNIINKFHYHLIQVFSFQ